MMVWRNFIALRFRPLERVPPDDGAKPAAITNGAHLLKHMIVLALWPLRRNDDPAPIERALQTTCLTRPPAL